MVVSWMNWGGEVLYNDVVVKEEPGTTRQKETKELETQRKVEKTKKKSEENKWAFYTLSNLKFDSVSSIERYPGSSINLFVFFLKGIFLLLLE